MSLAENLCAVKNEISLACAECGRDPSAVTLIAATKYVDAAVLRQLYDLGVKNFGENRVDALLPKAEALADLSDIHWHFIGHLQRNKAKKILPICSTIHSVDSLDLLTIIDRTAEAKKITPEILLEINLGNEDSKNGLLPIVDELLPLAIAARDCANLRFVGLMGMAPLGTDAESARPFFRKLADLRDNLQKEISASLPRLSMGMSGDFIGAIREGATMIRVGSRLFK